jgi:hypothetical protein
LAQRFSGHGNTLIFLELLRRKRRPEVRVFFTARRKSRRFYFSAVLLFVSLPRLPQHGNASVSSGLHSAFGDISTLLLWGLYRFASTAFFCA